MRMRSVRILLFAVAFMTLSAAASFGQVAVGISVGFGPPPLPVYEQPVCPGDGYIWTPGYWAWDPDAEDYYWVPGTWVLAPEPGYLWTPPWWGWDDGRYLFHAGYWGPQIGFYGGIDYGFGYFGSGFVGGRWQGGHFFYNRSVTNINVVNIHNVYEERVTHVTVNHVSYNGGNGGVVAHATAEQEAAAREHHIAAVAAQTEHVNAARDNRELRASANHGRPPIAATERAGGGLKGEPAREAGGEYHPPANRGNPTENRANEGRPANAPEGHVKDLAPLERPAKPNTGNPKLDEKYQKQQEKLYNKQNQERQKLEAQQEREHQQAQQRNYNQQRQQQMEQRHQQQTQRMQQRQQQQTQRLQRRQPAPQAHPHK